MKHDKLSEYQTTRQSSPRNSSVPRSPPSLKRTAPAQPRHFHPPMQHARPIQLRFQCAQPQHNHQHSRQRCRNRHHAQHQQRVPKTDARQSLRFLPGPKDHISPWIVLPLCHFAVRRLCDSYRQNPAAHDSFLSSHRAFHRHQAKSRLHFRGHARQRLPARYSLPIMDFGRAQFRVTLQALRDWEISTLVRTRWNCTIFLWKSPKAPI
jgi:hypothetical protein